MQPVKSLRSDQRQLDALLESRANWVRSNGPIPWIQLINADTPTSWLPDEEGNLPPRTKTFAPGEEVLVRRFLAVGTSPAQAYGRHE